MAQVIDVSGYAAQSASGARSQVVDIDISTMVEDEEFQLSVAGAITSKLSN